MTRRSVTVLGATGSIGQSAAAVIAAHPVDFDVRTVAAATNAEGLAAVAVRLGARRAVLSDGARLSDLREALAGTGIEAAAGDAALLEAASEPVDVVLSAIVGAAGVAASAAAVAAGSTIALANKECLVCAGAPFMRLAQKHAVRILPVDSEHNALFQLLDRRDADAVSRFTITASGGPFRTWPAERIAAATAAEALAHPTWSMGAKISIDSATMMNKGLELIEAHQLFGLPADRLDVLVHPQSLVHGLVTFADGSIHAELGAPDMRRPIAYCLYWPARRELSSAGLDLAAVAGLTFEAPDLVRFPALRIAREALEQGGGAPTVLNAANEIAVEAFLEGRIGFTEIASFVECALIRAGSDGLLGEPGTIAEALALDREARNLTLAAIEERRNRRHSAVLGVRNA